MGRQVGSAGKGMAECHSSWRQSAPCVRGSGACVTKAAAAVRRGRQKKARAAWRYGAKCAAAAACARAEMPMRCVKTASRACVRKARYTARRQGARETLPCVGMLPPRSMLRVKAPAGGEGQRRFGKIKRLEAAKGTAVVAEWRGIARGMRQQQEIRSGERQQWREKRQWKRAARSAWRVRRATSPPACLSQHAERWLPFASSERVVALRCRCRYAEPAAVSLRVIRVARRKKRKASAPRPRNKQPARKGARRRAMHAQYASGDALCYGRCYVRVCSSACRGGCVYVLNAFTTEVTRP